MLGSSRPRILIADDHVLVAEALKKFLVADFDVIGMVHDGRSLLLTAQALAPDVIVADIGMPLLNGLDAAERIKRFLPGVKFIFITITDAPDVIAEAFRRGASGYLLKTSTGAKLVAAIYDAIEGKPYLSPELCSSVPGVLAQFESTGGWHDSLTERQREVLQLLAEGRSMKETAAVLNLTTRTVAFHKYRIMNTLHLRNDADIVRYAMQNHMLFAA